MPKLPRMLHLLLSGHATATGALIANFGLTIAVPPNVKHAIGIM